MKYSYNKTSRLKYWGSSQKFQRGGPDVLTSPTYIYIYVNIIRSSRKFPWKFYNVFSFMLFYRVTYDPLWSLKIRTTTFDWLAFTFVNIKMNCHKRHVCKRKTKRKYIMYINNVTIIIYRHIIATKWLRILSLGGNYKIRNHLVANLIIVKRCV